MQITDGIYRDTIELSSYDTDPYNQAQTSCYFRIMQDVAGAHAYHRGLSIPQLREEGKTWVVTRTRMQIFQYAPWPQHMQVETWPQQPWKLYFPRVCRLYGQQGETLFQSLTHWVVMDMENQRPIKPQSIAQRFGSVTTEDFVDPNLGRRAMFDPDDFEQMITYTPTIRYHDCDVNQHVNNVIYLEWMLDSLPFTFRDTHIAVEVDIAYLAQTYRDDAISVRTGLSHQALLSDDTLILYHEILRAPSESVCVARTRWKRRDQ